MFEWLPEVCREIRGELATLYWILIVPFTMFLIVLEFFKIPEKSVGVQNIVKRAVISIILLITFEDIINYISILADGIVEYTGTPSNLEELLDTLAARQEQYQTDIFDFKKSIILLFNTAAYLIAYLGIFVSNALIHFTTGMLFCLSPLMILMHISEKTSGICSNLYRGLLHVASWKILHAILGLFLLKLASTSGAGDWSNVFTNIVVNVCIGLSMLFIPIFASSLLSNGLTSMASMMAVAPAFLAAGAIKAKMGAAGNWMRGKTGQHIGKPMMNEAKNTGRFAMEISRMDKATHMAKRGYKGAKDGITKGRKTSADAIRKSTGLEPKHRKPMKNQPLPKNVVRLDDYRNKGKFRK